MNTLKKDREQVSLVDKYPWLDPEDKRRNMTDMEILEKYINLEMSCLNKKERVEVMDLLYKYKETFSLRDEIGKERKTISLGKGTTRLLYGNKMQIDKTTSTAYAKQDRKVSPIL